MGGGTPKNRRIKDIKNNIVSIHHFPNEIPIEKSQEVFLQQMNKRFQRLDENLNKAKKIVLIGNRIEKAEELGIFLTKFSALYPHLEICLLNMRNDDMMDAASYHRNFCEIDEKLTLEEYSFLDTWDCFTHERAGWKGNRGMWTKILSSYYNYHKLEVMKKLENENLVIFGAGKRCMDLLNKFETYNLKIKGIAVTDVLKNPKKIRGYDVDRIEKYEKSDFVIVSLADRKEAENIKNDLIGKGYGNLCFVGQRMRLDI